MRCVALAQAWQDAGGRALFAMAETTPAISHRLQRERCEVGTVSAPAGTEEDARQTIALARQLQSRWIAVDGYQFGADYQVALKEAGFKILFLDDYGHARHYSADLVLNQNVGVAAELYADRGERTRLLIGPRYCLLRREFAAWRTWKREIAPTCRRLLVTMGGSDPKNLTLRVLRALANFEDLEVMVVTGGSNPHAEELEVAAAESPLKITMQRDVANMAEPMASADVAVSAAGSTCWEICLLGLPALLVDVATNQTSLAKELGLTGCAIHVGNQTVSSGVIAQELRRLCQSRELRQSLALRSRALVDGEGAKRVISVLRGMEGWHLRLARAEDQRTLWEWANDPEVRAASFSSAPIPWETHVTWFAEKSSQGKSLILIAEDEQAIPFGQIRFDLRSDGDAELNISLARDKRGKGLGVRVIEAGVRELFVSTRCPRVHAFVKPENVASTRVFTQADFVRVGVERVRGNDAVHFVYDRN